MTYLLLAMWTPFPVPSTTDSKSIEGEWRCLSYIRNGERQERVAGVIKLKVTRHTIHETVGNKKSLHFSYYLVGPQRINFRLANSEAKEKLSLGLYDLQGDQLTFCWGSSGGKRPAKIAIGKDITFSRWRRVRVIKELQGTWKLKSSVLNHPDFPDLSELPGDDDPATVTISGDEWRVNERYRPGAETGHPRRVQERACRFRDSSGI